MVWNSWPSISVDEEPMNRRARCINFLNHHNNPVFIIYYHHAPFSEEESEAQRGENHTVSKWRARMKTQIAALRAHLLHHSTCCLSVEKAGAYNSWLSPYINSSCLCLGLLVTTRKQGPQSSMVVLSNLSASKRHPNTTHSRKQALFQARVTIR